MVSEGHHAEHLETQWAGSSTSTSGTPTFHSLPEFAVFQVQGGTLRATHAVRLQPKTAATRNTSRGVDV